MPGNGFARRLLNRIFHSDIIGLLPAVKSICSGNLEGRSNVDLAYPVMDAGLEILDGSAAPAVKDERGVDSSRNLTQTLNIKLWRSYILTVKITYCYCKSVGTSLADKLLRLGWIGEDVGSLSALVRSPRVSYTAQLGLDIDAANPRGPDHLLRIPDILLKRQRSAVEHHGVEAKFYGTEASFDALAVVEMDADRHGGVHSQPQEHRSHKLHRSAGELHLRNLKNQRRTQLHSSGNGSAGLLNTQAVERSDGIAALPGRLENT